MEILMMVKVTKSKNNLIYYCKLLTVVKYVVIQARKASFFDDNANIYICLKIVTYKTRITKE